MTKRLILFSIFIVIISKSLHAQQFLHSAGVSGSVMRATLKGPLGQGGRFEMAHIHLNYFPRANFPINYYSSVSAGVLLGVGAGFINNNFLSVKGTYLSYDVPLVIDYNVGYKAADAGDDHIGFYFGMGGGYTATQRDTLGVSSAKASSFGILARAGVRIDLEILNKTGGISMGFFHKIGMGEEKYKTSGLNVLFDF